MTIIRIKQKLKRIAIKKRYCDKFLFEVNKLQKNVIFGHMIRELSLSYISYSFFIYKENKSF